MAKAVSKKETADTERKVPIIQPEEVEIEAAYVTFKKVSVKLPDGLTLQDFNDNADKIWKKVQLAKWGKALARDDEVILKASTWTAWGNVNYADHGKVILYNLKRAARPQRDVALFSDDRFEVRHSTHGYAYFRKSDNVSMSGKTYDSPEAAKMALIAEQYPAQVRGT